MELVSSFWRDGKWQWSSLADNKGGWALVCSDSGALISKHNSCTSAINALSDKGYRRSDKRLSGYPARTIVVDTCFWFRGINSKGSN